jgi:isopentenyl-diphosphate delta-isomerase
MLHENTEDAARRRIKYELGLKVGKLDLVLPDFRYRAEKDGVVENEICPVFVAFSDTAPKPNPDEVHSVRWVPWRQFVEEVKAPANGYSPWAREEVELLMQSTRFRELGVESS